MGTEGKDAQVKNKLKVSSYPGGGIIKEAVNQTKASCAGKSKQAAEPLTETTQTSRLHVYSPSQ